MLGEVVFQIAYELAKLEASDGEPSKDDVSDKRSELLDKLFG